MADHPDQTTIKSLRAGLAAGRISASALTDSTLKRIHERTDLNAFITVTDKRARTTAARLDDAPNTDSGPLAGIPIAVKDNILVEGERCTCGSRMLSDWVAPYSATAVDRLEAAGAVIVGKTNCDEFGMGSSNENSYFKAVSNPVDPQRVPGGSSGGSPAAVADRQVIAALGSDTGGSVRLPAAYCGVVGLKPTYGAVSRWGLVAFASSLDQIGVLAQTIDDTRTVFNVIRGHDSRDATSRREDGVTREPAALRIGWPRQYFEEGLDPEIREAIENVARQLTDHGHRVFEVSLPNAKYAVATYYVICCAEASANLARYDGVKFGYRTESAGDLLDMFEQTRDEGFGAEVKRRILLGTYVLSAGYFDQYYGTAQRVRKAITQDFIEVFQSVDCLITPTAPTCAFKRGEKVDDPLAMYLMDVYTTSVNLAGVPALSVPCGRTSGGLPIGAQLIGRPMDENLLLHIGELIEQGAALQQ